MVRKIKKYWWLIPCFALGWYLMQRQDTVTDQVILKPVLLEGQTAKVILNPKKHRATIVTTEGVKEIFIGNHPSSVIVNDDGTVKVQTRKFGTELEPFVGLGYDSKLRLFAGAGVFYWHRFDLNVALALSPTSKPDLRFQALLSWNVYSNTHLFVGLDHRSTPSVGFLVRF